MAKKIKTNKVSKRTKVRTSRRKATIRKGKGSKQPAKNQLSVDWESSITIDIKEDDLFDNTHLTEDEISIPIVDKIIDKAKDLEEVLEDTTKEESKDDAKDVIEQILFKIPNVKSPLIGTPKQVRPELDELVLKMQKRPNNNQSFNKVHLYMHGYLINVVLRKFPFIRGFQTVDIYQETLIALRFKAIPNFDKTKGMSFLNFAKMCIRRHLITILNTSKNRKRDQSMNTAVSLDSSPLDGDDDSKTSLANIIPDLKAGVDVAIEYNEAMEVTKKTLMNILSDFEQTILQEYLSNSSYKEIAVNVSKKLKRKYNTKSIDNALLRIKKKAIALMQQCKIETLPIFMKD